MRRIILPYPPQNRDQLWYAVKALFGVSIPRTRVCPDHCAPFDAFADAYFRECTLLGYEGPMSRAIWHASRGLAGKSYSLATLGMTFAYIDGADITILGGSMSQSANVHEYMVKAMAYEGIPDGMTVDQTATKIKLTNEGRIRPLPASQKNVRGPHPSILLCVAGQTRVETPEGPQRIDALCVGQKVRASFDGVSESWDTVRRVVDQGYKRTLVVRLSDGREITCTPDHRFATGRGWIEARDLTASDVLTVRGDALRSTSQYDRPVRQVLRSRQDDSAEELLGVRRRDRRERRPQDRHVPGLLGQGVQPAQCRCDEALQQLRPGADRLERSAVPGLSQQDSGGQGSPLRRLWAAAEVPGVETLPRVSFEVHVVGPSGGAIRRGPGDRQRRDAHVTGRAGGPRPGDPAGPSVSRHGAVQTLDLGHRDRRDQDRDRGGRDVLARQAIFERAGRAQAGGTGGRWVAGAVLADRSQAPVVVGLRPGPVVRCWDITTDSHTFFAEGVLVHNCDEVDEMELDIYDAALGQPLPQGNYLGRVVDTFTVVSSTWQNAQGTFTEILKRADEKKQPVYKWCYRESSNPVDGWLTEKTIQDKKDEVSAEMFRIEYDLGEPSIGNRAFDGDAVEAAFSLRFKPEDPTGTGKGYVEHKVSKDFEEYRFARRVNAANYVAGADWAKEQDKTIIWVARIDGDQRELVYFLRVNRRPYPVMIKYLNRAIRYYRVPLKGVWHDSTGLGNVVNDYLDVRARPFPMTGDKRAVLLNDYVNAVEKGKWRIPRITSAYIEHKYCRTGDLYSTTKDYHLPDTVCAAALAEYAAKRFTGAAAPAVVKRSAVPTNLEKEFNGEADERKPAEDQLPVVGSFSLTV